MDTLTQLCSSAHRNLHVDSEAVEEQGGKLHLIPVVISEFLKLAIQYPICFIKHKETGQFNCVALFGFSPNENLFFTNNQWNSIYIPLHIQRQPFFLGETPQGNSVVCIDTTHPSLSTTHGKPLFNAQGGEADALINAKRCLQELSEGAIQTRYFIDTLLEFNLLESMHLEITFADESETRVEGLYTINEEKLNTLNPEQLVQLHRHGFLGLAYTQLTSLGLIYRMIDLKNRQLSV